MENKFDIRIDSLGYNQLSIIMEVDGEKEEIDFYEDTSKGQGVGGRNLLHASGKNIKSLP